MISAKKTTAVAVVAATVLGAVTLPAAAQSAPQHRYSAAQRQAYAAGFRRGFYKGQTTVAAAYAGQPGVLTGRSVAVGAPVAQPGVYGGPFNNGGLLGTGALSGNGVLGTGVFSGQGALGIGLLGF